jgi:hypothetical protein
VRRIVLGLVAVVPVFAGIPSVAFAEEVSAATATPLQFHGRVVAEFLDDGRTMRLTEPFGYTDPDGGHWNVPAGAVVDGASIPRVFWSFIGGPFEGKYRNASVVHDYYCDRKDRPWRHVHKVFYSAMIEAGVDETLGKLMYYAVYYFGPRWETIETAVVGLECPPGDAAGECKPVVLKQLVTLDLPTIAYNADSVEHDLSYILSTNPSLEEIETLH